MNWDSKGRRTVERNMKDTIGLPSAAILTAKLLKKYLAVPKEGGSREENCGRRTGKWDINSITGLPSAAILHGKIA